MGPAILAGATGIVFGKLAMEHSPLHSGVVYFAFIQSCVTLAILLLLMNLPFLKRKLPHLTMESRLFDKKTILAGALVAFFWLLHMPAKYYGISLVENPAYVTVIALTAPFWILLAYKLIGHKEDSDVWSGLGIVFCAMLLVAFTQL